MNNTGYMDVRYLKGVGEKTAQLLHRISIDSVEDLVENIPRDYIDYSNVQTIASLQPGLVTLKATISSVTTRRSKKGMHITEALARDSTGSVRLTWFNQPYRAAHVESNIDYFISGEFAGGYKYLSISNPSIERASDFPLHTARLVPKYRLTKGLNAHTMRKITKHAFEVVRISERLPEWMREQYALMPRDQALMHLHFPNNMSDVTAARHTIGFEELFGMTLASELNRQAFASYSAVSIPFQLLEVKKFVEGLPYTLTDQQRSAAWEIIQDMIEGTPMNRLLEGDVGSGKTVVAATALVNVAANGFQSALMAPTEILALQHASTLQKILPKPLSKKLALLIGSMTNKQKDIVRRHIADGSASIVIGTHALVQAKVNFRNLGFVVIDEQHRFGVSQRKQLQAKADHMPHVLNMTATPIPRSLMLTLYGEMDASILSAKPPGRTNVKTKIIKPENRQNLYESLKSVLNAGRQVYIVCPLIETVDDVGLQPSRPLSVDKIYEQIAHWLKDYSLEALHGKMKANDKEAIMKRFSEGQTQIVISTTVIEVGVDVPNATVMVIEGADKFGLAQIHQLRGRVGRGQHEGTCYLIPTDNDVVSQRLRLVEKVNDGFKLAEYDLKVRGPGALYGTLQHGALDLRVADITNVTLINQARDAAKKFIQKKEKLENYPDLQLIVNKLRTVSNLN